MKRLLLFDFDGVVADSLDAFAESFVEQCRDVGFDRIATRQDFLDLFDGNFLQRVLKAGLHPLKMRRFTKDFAPRITAVMAAVKPFEGMLALLTDVAHTHPTYIITSSMTSAVEGYLARHGVTGVLGVLGADQEPSKVKKIRQTAKRHPEAAPYYIGDTKGDMLEGREAGATTVAVTWGWHEEAHLRTAQPDHVVHTPDELRGLLQG
jgi:phosphoglycolate phosphatase